MRWMPTLLLITAGLLAPVASAQDAYQRALAHPDRPLADRERDADRHPAEVLSFFGIAPGDAVLEVFAGGGYYTEILSQLIGPDGSVLMYNNQAYVDFTQAELDARFVDGRLPNVTRVTTEVAELELAPGSMDAALFILAYHDAYFVNEPSWPRVDAAAMLAEVHASLRPGAVVGVVDHSATPGSGTTGAQDLHRIDEERLIADFEAAGFVLEARSDLLANPADDRSLPMMAPEVRGRTDRFVLRFRRP